MHILELAKAHRIRAALIGAVLGAVVIFLFLLLPVRPGSLATVTFVVEPGQGTTVIAHDLKSSGLIRSEQAFSFWVNLSGNTRRLQAGSYILSPGMNAPRIASIIASGQGISTDISVTVPEGTNIWDLDRILASSGLPIQTGRFSAQERSQEGRLFPETYRFAKDAGVWDVATRMTGEFQLKASAYTFREIIIASILEKEAKTAEDMAIVSGIIQKRLTARMPLQVDATVAYGWCMRTVVFGVDCDVTQAPIATEIKIDGPYNTYTRAGLPVGPISNPGLQALGAAANPKDSPYLYYLSTRDGSQLIYAQTLDEHLKNRLKYLGF